MLKDWATRRLPLRGAVTSENNSSVQGFNFTSLQSKFHIFPFKFHGISEEIILTREYIFTLTSTFQLHKHQTLD